MAGSNWSREHAQRLMWRAGFGARPDELDHWAARSRAEAVDWLIRGGRGPHGTATMVGPALALEGGKRLDPANEWGHDVLWWLDRMVRSQRPLVEKLTLFWHDHFATRDQDTPLMLAQNRTLRRHATGSFRGLLVAVTKDPAMQGFLSLVDSEKSDPNENYARELMELFTLGVTAGYTERDVREAARALTGFVSRQGDGRPLIVGFDARRHDGGRKVVLGRHGRLGWRDVLDACVEHRAHAPFLVDKLWGFFVTEPLDRGTRRRLVETYTGSGRRIAPVVREILEHPALYADLDRPAMIKSPVVHVAGLLRLAGRGIDTDAWTWILSLMGQELFSPPSVAGWDSGTAWLSTSAMSARFRAATYMTHAGPLEVKEGATDRTLGPEQQVALARAAVGRPWTSPETDAQLVPMTKRCLASRTQKDGHPPQYLADVAQAAVRHLLLAGPDAQLH